jgi:hypothetical protein
VIAPVPSRRTITSSCASKKLLGALLRFADFPVAVRRLVEARLEIAQLALHLADAGNEDAHGPARGAEQRGDADREHIGVVVGRRGGRSGEEAEGDRKRHRGDDGRADDQREQPAADNGGFSEVGARAHGPFPAWHASRGSSVKPRRCLLLSMQ